MTVSISPFRVATSLRLGDRVLTRCDDGVLLAEYALFDVSDIVLRATDPVTVREVGYMTTAGEALERLERAGVTFDVATVAARALGPEVAASYARGETARSLVARLGAHELFDGAIFSAPAQRYEGAWLDLRTLTGALNVPSAAACIQALHLCAALSEVATSTTLHLATAAATRNRRPGERTHQRVVFDAVNLVPAALAELEPLARPQEVEPSRDRLLRRALLARVNERSSADTKTEPRAHLAHLEGALTLKTMPMGPLTDPDFRAVERRIATGQLEGVDRELERLERAHGKAAGVRYLRARAALLKGEEPPRKIAQALSELVEETTGFHEAVLVAARTWLAVGEDGHARYFARRLFDDPSAGDSERLVALEILEATTSTDQSHAPPSVAHPSQLPPLAAPRVPVFQPLAHLPPPRSFPPDAGSIRPPPYPPAPRPTMPTIPPEVPAPVTQRSPPPPLPVPPRALLPRRNPPSSPIPPPMPEATPAGPPYDRFERPERQQNTERIERPEPPRSRRPPRSSPPPPPPTSPPPPAPRAEAPSPPPPRPAAPSQAIGRHPDEPRYEPELVETLALPFGASESTLGVSELPRTPLQARIALTRLSRDLARDYRLAYGKTLRCNVMAIDTMQQHLIHRFAGATLSDHGVTWELRRHGALLSEIVARALGGAWTDIAPTEPGYWAMSLSPTLVTYPIGRVYRFIALGHRGRDLIAYYLELETRIRGGR